MKLTCYFCKKEMEIEDRIGRRDECPYCSRDLHICMNCAYYDAGSYNECKEVQADRVVEKEDSNFCDYFTPGSNMDGKSSTQQDAKSALEALFKKNG